MSGPAVPKATKAVTPKPSRAARRAEDDAVADGTSLGIGGLPDFKALQVQFEQRILPLARRLGVTLPMERVVPESDSAAKDLAGALAETLATLFECEKLGRGQVSRLLLLQQVSYLDGFVNAMWVLRAEGVERGAGGRRHLGDETRQRIKSVAEPLRGTISKAQAAKQIAPIVKKSVEQVYKLLIEQFPAEAWTNP